MSTDVLVRKLNKEVVGLRSEVAQMRVKINIFEALAELEGEYTPAFVKKMLARESEPAKFAYSTKSAFLKHVRGK